MSWFTQVIAEAGFANRNPIQIFALLVLAAGLVGAGAGWFFRVATLGLAVSAIVLTVLIELLAIRARMRKLAVVKVLSEVVDNLHTALQSGLSIESSLMQLASTAPKSLRTTFQAAESAFLAGYSFESVVGWLKRELASEPADQLLELLLIAQVQGMRTIGDQLARLSARIRADLKLHGELTAKQGWVASTAKLGLIAPWVIVVMLSMRPENAFYYNSQQGVAVLLTGLFVCLIAYLAIAAISVLPSSRRVFEYA